MSPYINWIRFDFYTEKNGRRKYHTLGDGAHLAERSTSGAIVYRLNEFFFAQINTQFSQIYKYFQIKPQMADKIIDFNLIETEQFNRVHK